MITPPGREPQRTPLYENHRQLGAKIIDFGGWWMPVNYPAGILEEHRATRRAVGVFDVCHMGEIHFRGPRAAAALQRLVTNQVGKLVDRQALYTVACQPDGGIIDDLIVYRVTADFFIVVVNASNIEKDFAWFGEQVGSWCDIQDASSDTALISFQGPAAQAALQPLTGYPLTDLRSFQLSAPTSVAGVAVLIARTGYTGEDGFEIFCQRGDASRLWEALLTAAEPVGGKPVGLGARDTLRLESRLPLYGNDLTEATSPLEAGLGWVVKFDAGDFIGKAALQRQQAEGLSRRLAGFEMVGRGVARHGYPVHADAAGQPGSRVGEVTSGSVGPTVGKNIGLGYVPAPLATAGTRLWIDCRGRFIEAGVVVGPFYRRQKQP